MVIELRKYKVFKVLKFYLDPPADTLQTIQQRPSCDTQKESDLILDIKNLCFAQLSRKYFLLRENYSTMCFKAMIRIHTPVQAKYTHR